MPNEILERLRRETAPGHEAIERALDLMSPALTLERYTAILRFFLAAFTRWENALEAQCPPEYRALWAGRRKAYLAGTDLRTLGYAATLADGPAWEATLEPADRWLGSLYVMEGSTLGGQFIARRVEELFGWKDGAGYSYFRPYGEKTAERWRDVTRAIASREAGSNLVMEGAHLSYGYLLAWHPFPFAYECERYRPATGR